MTTVEAVVQRLAALGSPASVASMARFGIAVTPETTFGVSVPALRKLAKELGRDHDLALGLWATGLHEARILASMVDNPAQITEAQMEAWAAEIDSWDICDGVCGTLFDQTPFAYDKAAGWSERSQEYVKRAGFVLMAELSVHDKAAPDSRFVPFFPLIVREADDPRNFVKKAVNWALRQIGKRNLVLNAQARETALQVRARNTPSARWIAADALRELESDAVLARLQQKAAAAPRRQLG
ncbi:MAG: DNA alkylation repair protein [Chloroflexi bacterium]|nr:DNA alkylation repair protein [Chloroflexota bacterium]